MEADVKLVDLRKETLGTVREAIKIASTIGAAGFKLFVNKNFIKNGLILTKIVPVTGEEPPKTQDILNYAGLKNLKKTVEFAKKVLVEDGEVTVEEKFAPAIQATELVAEAAAIAEATSAEVPDALTVEDPAPEEAKPEIEAGVEGEVVAEEEEPKAEEPMPEVGKKRKAKKAAAFLAEESE